MNTSKIQSLGWKRKYSIETSLEKTVDWYRSNEWWWGPLRNRNSLAS